MVLCPLYFICHASFIHKNSGKSNTKENRVQMLVESKDYQEMHINAATGSTIILSQSLNSQC
jgi:hypothetical protein